MLYILRMNNLVKELSEEDIGSCRRSARLEVNENPLPMLRRTIDALFHNNVTH